MCYIVGFYVIGFVLWFIQAPTLSGGVQSFFHFKAIRAPYTASIKASLKRVAGFHRRQPPKKADVPSQIFKCLHIREVATPRSSMKAISQLKAWRQSCAAQVGNAQFHIHLHTYTMSCAAQTHSRTTEPVAFLASSQSSLIPCIPSGRVRRVIGCQQKTAVEKNEMNAPFPLIFLPNWYFV